MKKNIVVFVILLSMLACDLVGSTATSTPSATATATKGASASTSTPAAPGVPATAGGPTQAIPSPLPQSDVGRIARRHMEALVAIGARVPGSANEQRAAEYIRQTFANLGYAPQVQTFAAYDDDDVEFTSANVIAVKQGNSSKEIIVGAHYDSTGDGLGADDNASGVGVMLEIAERVAQMQTPYTVRFIAFGAEENDLDGSYFYADGMTDDEVKYTVAYVNVDAIAVGDVAYVYSEEGADAFLRDWVLNWASGAGFPLQTIRDVDLLDFGDYVADYGAFWDRGIPYIYFEATNWDLGDKDGYTQVDPKYGDEGEIWDTEFDTLVYIDATFPGRVDEHLRLFASALFAVCAEYR
ncbi:MAG: M20/M25/M40 family metallo-hydrolase [Chloroflexota bacterium]